MKLSLAVSTIVAAMALSACGSKADDQKSAPVKQDDDRKAAVTSEFDTLPEGAVLRVALDDKGNEDKDSAEMRFIGSDASAMNDQSVATSFASGTKADDAGFGVSMQATHDDDGLSLNSYDSYGSNGGGYYNTYRPHLISRLIRGAAWVLSRPIAWTVGSYRYYTYNRPDCGCYRQYSSGYDTTYGAAAYGNQGAAYGNGSSNGYVAGGKPTYVDVPVKDAYVAPVQTPVQPVPVPVPAKDYGKNPGQYPGQYPAQNPSQYPGQNPNYGKTM